ncbi:uncharacterized protein LOC130055039 [Ostrea edulis]|uniref:uncharacterized protein LOC130055039 n=1 Tax=Ostrea edulis TaxID=37623 RepID=UPI0024AFC5C7|nr:uncharacterized protein LOC130055039 [Ostrea edulis]
MEFLVAYCVFRVILFLCYMAFLAADIHKNETFLWKPRGWNGLELYCPNHCGGYHPTGEDKDICCACEAESLLDYNHRFSHLNISKDGYLEGNRSAENIALDYSGKHLQDFPTNICHFPGITRINFSFNLILEIPNLSCLPNLVHLDLSWNSLSAFPKDSLTENRNLRYVNLSHNFITYIEARIFGTLAFHVIGLNGNALMSVDVTNIVFKRPFCTINFSNNKVHIIVNEYDWKISPHGNELYGPGFVDLTFNQMKSNMTKLGFKNMFGLGNLLHFGFDVRYNPMICDCRIVEMLLYFKALIGLINRYYFDIKCESPEAFRGKSLPSIINNNEITDLVCNYSSLPVCPKKCHCVNMPKLLSFNAFQMKLVLYINCTGAKLKRLPHILPDCNQIEFYMSGNRIEQITIEHYLKRVTVLELQLMPSFETGALENLTHLQVFSVPRSQQLNGIPRALSLLNPCVFLQRKDFVMHCTCSHQWMVDWIQIKANKNCSSYSFKCLNGIDEEGLLTYLPRLVCTAARQSYVFSVVSTTIIIMLFFVLILSYIWKHEIKIIVRSSWMCTRSNKPMDQDCVVYLSYDEKIRDINSWSMDKLEPFLTRNGLSAFIPSRDLPLGSVRLDETTYQISVSRYYILFLSANYFEEESFQTLTDWNRIWNNYLSDSRKKLLIINYDVLDVTEVPCRKFRAIMRIGDVVDFASGENKIFSKISETFWN